LRCSYKLDIDFFEVVSALTIISPVTKRSKAKSACQRS